MTAGQPRAFMAAEACTELGADTAPPQLGLLRRLHVRLNGPHPRAERRRVSSDLLHQRPEAQR